jgi:hypothetical protein
MTNDLGAFARKLERIEADLTDKRSLTRLGVKAKADAVEALRGDIGDTSLSNWRRGRPVNLTPRFDVVASGVRVAPSRSKGPWRVLESGRSAGTAKSGRRVSSSAGKRTWSDAVRLMEQRTPGRVHDELRTVLKRHLTGG